MADRKKNIRRPKKLDDNQELYEKIGKRLKSLRLSAGYTAAEQFAYEHDFGRSQYTNWEVGQDMKISSLQKLAAAHNITMSELLEGIK